MSKVSTGKLDYVSGRHSADINYKNLKNKQKKLNKLSVFFQFKFFKNITTNSRTQNIYHHSQLWMIPTLQNFRTVEVGACGLTKLLTLSLALKHYKNFIVVISFLYWF